MTRLSKLKKSTPTNTPEKAFFRADSSLGSNKNDEKGFFPSASSPSIQAKCSKCESEDRQAEPTQQQSSPSIALRKGQPEDSLKNEPIVPLQPTVSFNSQSEKVIQRQLLPVGRHREIVKDAALRLTDTKNARENDWIIAIYNVLEGEGVPTEYEYVEELIRQRLIDENDWILIKRDIKLFKSEGKGSLDLHERHNFPAVHGESEADKWVASLIGNRIDDLYSTLAGFPGHAIQIQQNINQLSGWYQERMFSQGKYLAYVDRILIALKKGKKKSTLEIPPWTYSFFKVGDRQV